MKYTVLNPHFATTRMVIKDTLAYENSAQLVPIEGGLRTKGYKKQSYRATESSSAEDADMPLVTIITVVYNNDVYLAETIDSVTQQSYSNIEYIIIDGGSTDGTLDIIRQHEDRIDYWISEPDNGLYDAMNKGIALATGEIIGILNSDDLYFPTTVTEVVAEYQKQPQPCVIFGSLYKFAPESETTSLHRGDLSDRSFASASILINHPTCFVHHSLYRDFGGFKPEYEVGADRELMMRFHRQGVSFINLERAIAKFRLGGTTSNQSLSAIINREIVQEYRLLSAYSINKVIIAKVLGKKCLQSLRKWLVYQLLGEKLTNRLIMFYISRKFSPDSKVDALK